FLTFFLLKVSGGLGTVGASVDGEVAIHFVLPTVVVPTKLKLDDRFNFIKQAVGRVWQEQTQPDPTQQQVIKMFDSGMPDSKTNFSETVVERENCF
ncbi:MAG TPA: hypothetical protein PKK82_07230, partial [Anaerolineaceae bacterium]|nr:hypothetical protein [Anaerolineaceae bacterium]